jgi:hypothetical protein
MELTNKLAERVSEMLTRGAEQPTIERICELMVTSGVLDDKRVRQFLAVAEFYDRYEGKTRSLVEELSVKYEVSCVLLYKLIRIRRFKIQICKTQ